MSIRAADPLDHTIRGISLASMAYGLFAIQDAVVKWLVEEYSVPQLLFARSIVVVVLILLVGGNKGPTQLIASRNKAALLGRAVLILAAWLLFYSAARHLGLAELTTIYFAAPIAIVGLSVVVLGEKVDGMRWAIVIVGFVGVMLAAKPSGSVSLAPALMALLAAFCWGGSAVLVRLISRSESTVNQMLASNILFTGACALALPWTWQTPDGYAAVLMIALGVAGGVGQYLLFEAFRYAPASVLAPVEYVGLIWAFGLGYLIWNDIPEINVFAGAAIIVSSSLGLVWTETRRKLKPHEKANG